jgi:photosystem I subunit 12
MALLLCLQDTMNQVEILIALVVAAHAGVLAVRLGFTLYKA